LWKNLILAQYHFLFFNRLRNTIKSINNMKTISRVVLLMAFLIAGTAVGSYAQQEKPKKEKKEKDKDKKDKEGKKDKERKEKGEKKEKEKKKVE